MEELAWVAFSADFPYNEPYGILAYIKLYALGYPCGTFYRKYQYIREPGAIVKWLRHRPFTAGSWVQIPLASPIAYSRSSGFYNFILAR